MADYVFNIAKGRVVELTNRVKVGDPAASRLYLIPLSTTPAQGTAEDTDDFAALVTAGAVELTTGGWNRKTIAAADITALAPDDTNNRYEVDFIDETWTAVSAGNSVGLVVCYASVSTPTNSQLMPLTHHTFAVTADGSDVTAVIAATGFFRAT